MRNTSEKVVDYSSSPSLLGSGVFLRNSYERTSGNLQIESDSPGDILGRNIYLTRNGHSLIQDLLLHPLTEKSEILKRQKILKQMSQIDDEIFEKMNHQSQIIGYLFSAFTSDELTYRNFLNFAQKLSDLMNKKKPSNPHGAWSLGLDFDTIYNTGKLIPEHIQDIRAIGGEFYVAISRELEDVSQSLQQFPIREVFSLVQKMTRTNTLSEDMKYSKHFRDRHQEKLKKISEQYFGELQDIYGKYYNDIANFTRIYRVIDAIIILASHIRVDHITATQISGNGEEKGYNIRDARILLGTRMTRREDAIGNANHAARKDPFEEYIPNDLLKSTYPLEFYSGGNGSGKSSWLKTRLSLQLFHQTFGYGAGENISLPVKNKIVFMNRGGSGYAENLSAFGSDVEKLKSALTGNLGNTLFIFDELGSTIPEGEAYALTRGLIEFLRENGAKIIFSTHNEQLITAIEWGEIPGSFMGHFPTEFTSNTINYSRKLTPGADIAHTLSVFGNIGFDQSTLSQARIMMNPGLKSKTLPSQKLTPITLQSYTPEERESLKNMTGIGFAGLSRAIDILPSSHPDSHRRWYLKSPLPKRREEDFFPHYTISRYASSDDGSLTKEEYIPPSFDLNGSLKSAGVDFPHELYPILTPKNTTNKFDYCSDALRGVLSFGMTSDPKELLERQQFFSELQNLKADDIDELSNEIYKHSYLVNAFHRPRRTSNYGHNSSGLRCDFGELKEFNKVLWNTVLSCEDFWGGRDRAWIDTVIKLFDIEKILGNINNIDDYLGFITRLKRYRNLSERLERAGKREWKKRYEGYKGISEASSQVSVRINTLFQEEFAGNEQGIQILLQELGGIVSSFAPHDILKISKKKKEQIWKITKNTDLFRVPKEYEYKLYGDSILKEGHSTHELIDVINALQGTGTLIDPLLAELRSLDSIHAHQIASYIESMIHLPTTEEFTDRIKRRVRDPLFLTEIGNWNNPRYTKEAKYILPRMYEDRHFHPVQIINELCGLVRTANRIKELSWKPVTWNTTGEIDIRGLSHPGKRELPRETQVHSDFSLKSTQHFDILEGATMGGKTMHIQSVMWTIRLAHSLGYVPAESAQMPIFDGIIYLDRILEDENRNMSAGQKDAQYWKELIDKVIARVGVIGVGGRYWWSIDEMISSVPSRYQKGLVIAILEKLKSLGQRGQISIHNPDFVSKILAIDPESYTVHHPEIIIGTDGQVESTHKIIPGRSRDRDGNFSAFSLETAEMMGLDPDIIKRAKKHRSETHNENITHKT